VLLIGPQVAINEARYAVAAIRSGFAKNRAVGAMTHQLIFEGTDPKLHIQKAIDAEGQHIQAAKRLVSLRNAFGREWEGKKALVDETSK